MSAIAVEFDGRVFVPVGPVALPVGAKCVVQMSPVTMSYASPAPPPLTPDQQQRWDELRRVWEQTAWPWETVEQAFGRPRYTP